jgi:hypothetical protein
MRYRVLALAGITIGCSVLSAQGTPQDSLLDRMIGSWVMEGQIGRRAVTHDVECSWVLGREYVQIHEVSREKSPSGTPAYEAIIYVMWDPALKQFAALWLDNTAKAAFPEGGVGRARAAGDSIPFVFADTTSSGIHNTFLYDRLTDSWQWRIDNIDRGVATPFARLTLWRRKTGAVP